MSVATEVSSALFWHPFEGSVDKEPLFVQYNKYQAQSANSTDVSWYIESPANGVLLDNEVWIRTELTITDDADETKGFRGAMASNVATNAKAGIAKDPNLRTGFRFGSVLQKACQNISLDINGTVMTYEFSKYHDAFNRLFITQEEAETFYPAVGGGFDDGAHEGLYDGYYSNAAWKGDDYKVVANELIAWQTGYKTQIPVTVSVAGSVAPYAGMNQYINNHGFTKRCDFFEKIVREGGGPDIDPATIAYQDSTLGIIDADGENIYVRYVSPLTYAVYEKIAIPPFHLYDNRDIKMSIPNIRTFQLTFQLHSNAKNLMFRSAALGATFTVDWYTIKPQLLMRWYTPPPGYQIPKQITIPCTKVFTYTSSEFVGKAIQKASAYPIRYDAFNKSNISLPAMPDLFLIFVKRRLTDYTLLMPDDYNLSISSLTMDMEGNSGKLISSEPIHLWNMYKRHLRLYPCSRDNFDSWYKYHCIVPITASDLGVIKGAGMDNPIQVTISNLQCWDYHNVPSYNYYIGDGRFNGDVTANSGNAVAFDFHLVCIYDKYALTLTSDGSSALQLLRVNTMGTSTMPPSSGGGPSSLADIAV